MLPDFFRTLDYIEEVRLTEEAKDWLLTLPSLNDLWYYISKLPDYFQHPLVSAVCTSALEQLYEEKQQYFIAAGSEVFVRNLPEIDQLRYLMALGSYSPESVQKNITKDYPTFPAVAFPVDIAPWAREYTGKIDRVLSFSVSVSYLTLRFYTSAMLKTFTNYSALALLREDLILLTREIQERYRTNTEISQVEKDREKEIFLRTGFLEESSLTKLLDQGDSPDKNELILNIVRSIGYIFLFKEENPEIKDIKIDKVQSIILEALRLEANPLLIAKMENLRRRHYPIKTPRDDFLQLFIKVWTPANLDSGKIASLLIEEYQKLDISKKPDFAGALYGYLRFDNMVEVIIDPLHLDYILHAVRNVGSEGLLLELTSQLDDQISDPELQGSFRKLLHELFLITHNIPQP